MPGPLDGVRILELPAIGPVPFLGMLLADLGAEVIRIDRASSGLDAMTGVGPTSAFGRGRRSVVVDLKKDGGAEVILRIAASCDALIEGFRPGVAERLGVGPAEVLARNPRLVYGRMTGWGQDGPLAPTAGHDINYLAISGILHGIGPADRPWPPINYAADFGGGSMFLAVGLLAAILHARATGEGQVLDAAMTEGAAYLGTMTRLMHAQGSWKDERASNLLDGGAPHYRCYECADGGFMAIGPLEPQFWAAFSAALELDTTATPYFAADWPELTALLESTFKTRTRDEWAALLAPLDACAAPVLSLEEAPAHPHNAARSSYGELDGAVLAAPSPKFSATPASIAPLVAELGADTDSVLAELGYSPAELDALRDSKTIA